MTVAGADGSASRRRIFIVTPPGLEPVAAAEVAALDMEPVPEAGGLALDGDDRALYCLNLHLRTASRVLVRIADFRARTFYELERHAARVPWSDYLGAGRAVRLRVTSRKSRLYHQRAIEQRLLGWLGAPIVEAEKQKEEEDEQEGEAEQLFVVRFLYDHCVISADSSGPLLHRRGYRQAIARAPLRETLAAAMLLAGGWDGSAPLLDPLCGSGTIPIEAALIARNIAPGLARADRHPRGFAFTSWPRYDRESFRDLVDRARERCRDTARVRIAASDRDAGAVQATLANARRAGVENDIELNSAALSAVEATAAGGWLVTNPPYGARVGDPSRLRDLYAGLGTVARRVVPGGRLTLLSADRRLEAQVGLPLREILSTRNGGLPVRLLAGDVPRAETQRG